MKELTQNDINTVSVFAITLVREDKLTAESFDSTLRYLADNVGGEDAERRQNVRDVFTQHYTRALFTLRKLPPSFRGARLTACVAAARDDGATYPCFVRDVAGLPWRRYGNCVAVNAELVRNTSALWPHSKGAA